MISRQSCEVSSTLALSTDVPILFAPFLRRLESDMGDTTDFRFSVTHCIETFTGTLKRAVRSRTVASWLAEVNVTGQFADDQQIQSGNDFRFQRRSACQFRIEDGRTQIGEQFQVFAQP